MHACVPCSSQASLLQLEALRVLASDVVGIVVDFAVPSLQVRSASGAQRCIFCIPRMPTASCLRIPY